MKVYEYEGGLFTVAELSEISGLGSNVIRVRLSKGMTAAEALAKPVKEDVQMVRTPSEIRKSQFFFAECLSRQVAALKAAQGE